MGPTYTITESLPSAGRARFYRAVRNDDRCRVILKVLQPERRRREDLDRLRQEYEIGSHLATSATVRPISLETHEGMPSLVLEDFGGQTLDTLLGAPLAMERFLPLAIRIADAVTDIHEQGLVHRDLQPSNILVNPTTGEVKIGDLGAACIPSAHQPSPPFRHGEGSLPYLSPEQTGPSDRPIDARADLYALGMIFHQLLAGRLPFEARDAAEWVHCHLARTPPSVSKIVPEVPEVIARIVRKLLSKMPEDRYQSAPGLQVDLETCLAARRASGRIEPFALGEGDVTGRLRIPQKVYGREIESARLREAFYRVIEAGTPELLLVSGYSGIGKTTLVHELVDAVVRAGGFFVSGKFDQHRRDIPHAALAQAFHELVLEVLAQSEARVAAFRARLLAALSKNAQLIVDLIPSVELVIGPQPPAPVLPPLEAENRFRLVFANFVGVFAQAEHPLVLFLDDLQWADPASLALLEDLLTQPEVGHLLVVGAYRDNEVAATDPLLRVADEVRRAARVSRIVLGPIPPDSLAALVAEALVCPIEEAAPLAALVYQKTEGSPFHAIQFLTTLYEERLLEFEAATGAFRCDLTSIEQKGFTDNVADLVVGKIRRLAPATQEALRQLACLGHTAEVSQLTTVLGAAPDEIHTLLWDAVCAQLLRRLGGTYRFSHDRIQEAAYSLIPEEQRPAAHLRIGRLLAAAAAPETLEEKVFEIVNQLDRGAALITSPAERIRVAELNLLAGTRARGTMAYASALGYFALGADLLGEDGWEQRYPLAFALELNRAECEFLTGDHAAEEVRLARLSGRARGLVDVAAVTCARLVLYTTLGRSDRAIEACLEYLGQVGIAWTPHPSAEEVRDEYQALWRRLGTRSIEGLVDLPAATDPAWCATMDVLTRSQSAALFTDANLHCLLVGRMANISLEHGNSDGSCLAYIRLGSLLGPLFGDYQRGFRFGKLGLDLVDRGGLLRFEARAQLDFGYLVHPWTRSVRGGLEIVRRAFAIAQETGDRMYAAFAGNRRISLLLAAGDPLGEVQRDAENALVFARGARFGLVADIIAGQLALIRRLRGLTPVLSWLDDGPLDEERFEQHLSADPRLALAACWYWIRKLQAQFFAGDYPAALAAGARAGDLLWTSPSFFEVAEYHFYRALALAAARPVTAGSAEGQAELRAHHEQLEVWAENCPENFENRAALVGAEIARLDGDAARAAALYDRAIRGARDSGCIQNEAIAHETAARFYRAGGFEVFADAHLHEARDRYLRWGADGKVAQLERQFPQLVSRPPPSPDGTSLALAGPLDLGAAVQASQTISGEIVFDRLVRTLLEVLLVQGGAQRASLILPRDGGLSIEGEMSSAAGGPVMNRLGPLPLDPTAGLPVSVLQYVHRTRESVVLGEAAADSGRFASDEYLLRARPRSVLCTPISRQAEVVGLLYLENALLAGAFTAERVRVVELCAAQAAISLHHAQVLATEQRARAATEEAGRRAAFLVETAAVLSQTLEYEEIFARLGRLCVRSLADWCSIDVVEDGQIRRVAVAHAHSDEEPALRELQRRFPPRWDSHHPASTVLNTGRPLLIPDVTDEILREVSEDDEHLGLLRSLGVRSAISVPLVARGRTLGALTLGSARPGRRYTRADLDLVAEVAAHAAIAIDNARLYQASREAVRARDEFLDVASHELNTPVTSLMLAVQTLRARSPGAQPLDPEVQARMCDIVFRQGNRLGKLMADLLDVSRLAAGRFTLELSDVPLALLVREVVDRLEVDLTRAGCPVSIHDCGPLVGRWDRSRLDQVVTNLLSNAIKFGAGKPIDLSVTAERGIARLSVQDQGIGIDLKQKSRIFGRFERAVSQRNYGGLGLGLYISRRIVEAHGGSIRCESEPGAGATFIIELPCPAAAGAA